MSEIEQKINKILNAPTEQQVVRECLLWLLLKHTKIDSNIEVERAEISSSHGSNKLVFTVTICE